MNSNLHLLDDIAMMPDTVITAIIPMITKAPPPATAAIRRLTSRVPAVPIICHQNNCYRQNY